MKRIYIILALLAFLTLSASNVYLWKDRQEMWNILNMQIHMLNGLLSGTGKDI